MNLIFMEPVFKDYLWGGNRLKNELNKKSNLEITAESWEVSSNKNGDCRIINEEYNNLTLSELYERKELREPIFGTRCIGIDEFPLLVKYIDAKQNLSIQVHPDDEYAKSIGVTNGKNEMWYIMDCEENSQIIAGLNKKLNKQELEDIIKNDKIKEYLNYTDIKKGDSIYIPAGTVHAILGGVLICEIQQNSDITYRVYDWDRKDKNGNSRELHKEQAIKTIKPDVIPEVIHENSEENQMIVSNKYFEVEKINISERFVDKSDTNTFYLINVVEGEGKIKTQAKEYQLRRGDSFLIPATLGEYIIEGKITALKTFCIGDSPQ